MDAVRKFFRPCRSCFLPCNNSSRALSTEHRIFRKRCSAWSLSRCLRAKPRHLTQSIIKLRFVIFTKPYHLCAALSTWISLTVNENQDYLKRKITATAQILRKSAQEMRKVAQTMSNDCATFSAQHIDYQ